MNSVTAERLTGNLAREKGQLLGIPVNEVSKPYNKADGSGAFFRFDLTEPNQADRFITYLIMPVKRQRRRTEMYGFRINNKGTVQMAGIDKKFQDLDYANDKDRRILFQVFDTLEELYPVVHRSVNLRRIAESNPPYPESRYFSLGLHAQIKKMAFSLGISKPERL